MSLMAGFDIVLEILNPFLLNYINHNVFLGGTGGHTYPLSPPFEIWEDISDSTPSGRYMQGNVQMFVRDVELNLNADDTATLTMPFDQTSVFLNNLPIDIMPLDGVITILGTADPRNTNNSQQVKGIDFISGRVAVSLTPRSLRIISDQLAGTGITQPEFMNIFIRWFTNLVRTGSQNGFPFINVVGGRDAQLSSDLQQRSVKVERLEVHCIANSDRGRQALGLFGILLVNNDANGNSAQKTATAITPGHNICLSISSEVFHRFFFCPNVAQYAFGDKNAVDRLPTSCGSSNGFSKNEVFVTEISETFQTGEIWISVRAEKSGFCYDAKGSVTATMSFDSVSTDTGVALRPRLNFGHPNIDVHHPFYCYLGLLAVTGAYFFVVSGLINDVIEETSIDLVENLIKTFKTKLRDIFPGIPSLGGRVSIDQALISQEGLTLNGAVETIQWPPDLNPPRQRRHRFELHGSVTNSNVSGTVGIYHSQDCPVGDFHYIEWLQEQTGTYEAVIVPAGRYTFEWWVNDAPLTGSSGTISVPVEASFPFPLPGGFGVSEQAHISYTISENSVQLSNTPSEGNYPIVLRARTTLPGGLVRDTEVTTYFIGISLDMQDGFTKQAERCIMDFIKGVKSEIMKIPPEPMLEKIYGPGLEDLLRPPVDYPRPEELLNFVYFLATSKSPGAEEILAQAKLAHGDSFYRALFSPEATKIGLRKNRQEER